jgi:rhodanese-related sulfurtransferase
LNRSVFNVFCNFESQFQERIAAGAGGFYLVDVLPPQSYAARHIPQAINIPKGADFVERFEKETKAPKDAEIIVYCSSSGCGASVVSAAALEAAGYTNVLHYKEGLAGWK